MYAVLTTVLALLVIDGGMAVSNKVLSEWTAADYPNPARDWTTCGRYEKSLVCDPNGLLNTKEGIRFSSDIKVVPNTFTKINLARLIFIKFCQSIYFNPLTKI